MKTLALGLAVLGLVVLTACEGREKTVGPETTGKPRKSAVEIDPSAASFAPKAGQTIYVPVYSSVSISDKPHTFNLAINLSIRNTDRKGAVIVKSVQYFDPGGTLIQEYTPKPLRLGPLASADFFVKESDKAGGQSACFLVDWIADETVTDPLVESVMVGTANTQGVSFTCPGRVLTDMRKP